MLAESSLLFLHDSTVTCALGCLGMVFLCTRSGLCLSTDLFSRVRTGSGFGVVLSADYLALVHALRPPTRLATVPAELFHSVMLLVSKWTIVLLDVHRVAALWPEGSRGSSKFSGSRDGPLEYTRPASRCDPREKRSRMRDS